MMSDCSCLHFSSSALTKLYTLVSCTEANEPLLLTRAQVSDFKWRYKRVKEPRGEDVFDVEVDDDDVFAGGLVAGSFSWQ